MTPPTSPSSLKADFARLPAALDAALAGRQLQPVLLGQNDERVNVFSAGEKCGILLSDALPVSTTGRKTLNGEKPDEKTDRSTVRCAALICVFVLGAAAAGPALVPPAHTASSMQTPALCWHSRI